MIIGGSATKEMDVEVTDENGDIYHLQESAIKPPVTFKYSDQDIIVEPNTSIGFRKESLDSVHYEYIKGANGRDIPVYSNLSSFRRSKHHECAMACFCGLIDAKKSRSGKIKGVSVVTRDGVFKVYAKEFSNGRLKTNNVSDIDPNNAYWILFLKDSDYENGCKIESVKQIKKRWN